MLDTRNKIVLLEIEKSGIENAILGWDKYKSSQSILSETKEKNSVVLDVVTAWEKSMDSKVTTHAVEKGANISDHVLSAQPQISISAKISDLDVLGFSIGNFFDKGLAEKIELLEKWYVEGTPLFFLSYSNDSVEMPLMILTSLKISKPQKMGKLSRDIQIVLTKIEVAFSDLKEISLKRNVKVTNGIKKTSASSEPVDNKINSPAYNVVNK